MFDLFNTYLQLITLGVIQNLLFYLSYRDWNFA